MTYLCQEFIFEVFWSKKFICDKQWWSHQELFVPLFKTIGLSFHLSDSKEQRIKKKMTHTTFCSSILLALLISHCLHIDSTIVFYVPCLRWNKLLSQYSATCRLNQMITSKFCAETKILTPSLLYTLTPSMPIRITYFCAALASTFHPQVYLHDVYVLCFIPGLISCNMINIIFQELKYWILWWKRCFEMKNWAGWTEDFHKAQNILT